MGRGRKSGVVAVSSIGSGLVTYAPHLLVYCPSEKSYEEMKHRRYVVLMMVVAAMARQQAYAAAEPHLYSPT